MPPRLPFVVPHHRSTQVWPRGRAQGVPGLLDWPSLVVPPTCRHELGRVAVPKGFLGCLMAFPGRAP